MDKELSVAFLPPELRLPFVALVDAEKKKQKADARYHEIHNKVVALVSKGTGQNSFSAMLTVHDLLWMAKGILPRPGPYEAEQKEQSSD